MRASTTNAGYPSADGFSHRVRELASLLPGRVAEQLSTRSRGPVARREDRLLLHEHIGRRIVVRELVERAAVMSS
jgi:hypothetical protein